MHNETKVNTKKSTATTYEAKKAVLATNHIGVIDTQYGTQLIKRGSAVDHAAMRGRQLSSLLLLIQGEFLDGFLAINRDGQESLVWLATQLADEMVSMVDIIAADAHGSQP
jgi:hypothetical protein